MSKTRRLAAPGWVPLYAHRTQISETANKTKTTCERARGTGIVQVVTWGTVSTGFTGVWVSDGALRLVAPEACCTELRGVRLGVAESDVSRLAEPSRTLARDDARTEVERLGLLGTVSRRGVPAHTTVKTIAL
jgi:hypothetical protein